MARGVRQPSNQTHTAGDAVDRVQLVDDAGNIIASLGDVTIGSVTITDALPAGDNNIGDVDVASIAAGDNNIGNVDIASAIPAGTNNIGDVDIASAIPAGNNNIGDVDVASIAAGDNNIGNVDVVTLPALAAGTNNIGDVDVLTLPATPAGTNLIGRASVSQETSTIYNAATALTPKWAKANVSASSTDSAVVAAVTSKKIRVLQLIADCGATATDITFNTKPAGSGTAISPTFQNGENGGEVLGFSPVGWFETVSGEGLSVTTGAGSTTGVLVAYVEV